MEKSAPMMAAAPALMMPATMTIFPSASPLLMALAPDQILTTPQKNPNMKRIPRAVLKPCCNWLVEPPVVWAKTGVRPASDLPVKATDEEWRNFMARLSHE